MKVKGDLPPSAAFTLEPVPNKPGYVLARFYENAVPYTETRDGVTTSGYEYDEYDMVLLDTATLEAEIEAQYPVYLEQAKLNEIQQRPFDPVDYHKRDEEMDELAAAGGIVFVTMVESGNIDAATAAEHADLFAQWATPVSYKVGQIRRYADGKLYKCLTAHTSQENWTPDASPSLWVAISDPNEEWPEWSQPVGAMDAYRTGAKVSHEGKHWTSLLDGNVWAPGVYGWKEV